MKIKLTCPVLKAKEYQIGFEAGLQLKGFRDGKIKWDLKTKK